MRLRDTPLSVLHQRVSTRCLPITPVPCYQKTAGRNCVAVAAEVAENRFSIYGQHVAVNVEIVRHRRSYVGDLNWRLVLRVSTVLVKSFGLDDKGIRAVDALLWTVDFIGSRCRRVRIRAVPRSAVERIPEPGGNVRSRWIGDASKLCPWLIALG